MRGRWLLACVGAALALAGCNVGARVQITVRADGSGTVSTAVTLDAEAVAHLGGPAALARAVPLDDLRAAGWTVSPWRAGAAGARTVVVSHPFADQSELTRRLTDLAGPHGVLREPVVTRERGWFTARDALSVVVDVRAPSVDLVHDTALASRLRAAHVDPVRLQAQLASQLRSALHVSVVLELPGRAPQSFDVATGRVQALRVEHASTDWNRIVRVGIGVLAALLAALFLLAATLGARLSRRRASRRVGDGPPTVDHTPTR